MQLHLHPTRNEALTASATAITRWSLTTNPATVLARFSTAPEWLFPLRYDAGGRMVFSGGITGSPDGRLFAVPQLPSPGSFSAHPNMLEWRRWDDLLPARSSEVAYLGPEIESLACSPDGRWLVIGSGYAEQLFLLDWQTGEVMSRHDAGGYFPSGLTFDQTSTFVAGFSCNDNGGALMLWRLDPAERFVPRPPKEDWWTQELLPQDEVSGSMALSVVHWVLDRAGIEWPYRDLADASCVAAFSPDSRIVIYSPMNSGYSGCGLELVAYEVASGQRLWCVRHVAENSGPFILSPDGTALLVPVQGGDLLVYRVEDGTLVQQLPSGLGESVQALAFDHDGKTLWLATGEALVQYQPHV